MLKKINNSAIAVALSLSLSLSNSFAADNGSQMNESFRINYAGYLPQASKLALYLKPNSGAINWTISGTSCSGTETTYVNNDVSSGDSFYQIDFSDCTETGTDLRLVVGADQSLPFDISNDPYGNMKYEFFDYFKDHEASATFTNAKNNWQSGLSISFPYVRDAGDNGAYPVNTAEAAWSLINMLEEDPAFNTYYSTHFSGARTVYSQLLILTEQFDHVFDHGGPLAIPKFHTNVNSSWAACSPYTSGTCISEPETKATFSAARTLAAMARLHWTYGSPTTANNTYQKAKTALTNGQAQPLVCNQNEAFGGEGGMYPDNDNYSIYRDPKSFRDNCVSDKNNTEDDEYAALVEMYLAALKLGKTTDAASFANRVTSHARFAEASSFWWGAVVMEANLSLLTNANLHSLNLGTLKSNILSKADAIRANQSLGYPGVTWDPYSDDWDSGDQDSADNNVRWGSHRMALNDARILMAACNIQLAANQNGEAATYARAAIQVLDHISGLNPMNLAMFTTQGYSQFEHSVTRTHDGANGGDSWPGKMVLGPNNWTNADDPDMPAFNSLPGLKMFAHTGTGWSSREVSIDANGSLVPVAYFTTELAPAILALDPLDSNGTPNNVPSPPSAFIAAVLGSSSIQLSWNDNSGNNDDGELGFKVYQATANAKPSAATATLKADTTNWLANGLSPSTTYYFWVEAFNAQGTSPPVTASVTTADQPAYTNLINNGDFSAGTANWNCSTYSATASCAVVNGEYVVSISSGGNQAWNVQPKQGAITLASGKTYTFAFDARATSNRTTEIKIERSVSPWENFSQTGAGQNLTNQMQRFRYSFTMPTSLTDARIVMNIGNSNTSVVVDNVWLVEGSNDPCGGMVGCVQDPVTQFHIEVSAGANGTISPSSLDVDSGASQTFVISANPGYHIANVLKNGVSLGAVSSVSFNNVSSDQTLSATFAQDSLPNYTIAVTASAGGSVTPGTTSLIQGASQTFVFTPDNGYLVDDVLVNGVSQGAINGYSFTNVTSNQSLAVEFVMEPVTHSVDVRMRGVVGNESVTLSVGGTAVKTWTLSTSMATYSATTDLTGEIRVAFTNDAGSRDVRIDYVVVDGVTRQAEDQDDNTGVWGNGSCGGGTLSEWLHCTGYIGFGPVVNDGSSSSSSSSSSSTPSLNAISVRMRGVGGTESVTLLVGGSNIQTWTLANTMAIYRVNTAATGEIRVAFTNDASGRDVQVDYININGEIRQAEDQDDNTGVWGNSSCGGGTLSEWLHCNGSIGFGRF